MPIFRVFGRLEVGNGVHGFGEGRMAVLYYLDAPVLEMVAIFRQDEDLLPDNLIDLPSGRLTLASGLVLIIARIISNSRILIHLQSFITIVELPLILSLRLP